MDSVQINVLIRIYVYTLLNEHIRPIYLIQSVLFNFPKMGWVNSVKILDYFDKGKNP